jgi:hypothetical protein
MERSGQGACEGWLIDVRSTAAGVHYLESETTEDAGLGTGKSLGTVVFQLRVIGSEIWGKPLDPRGNVTAYQSRL